MRWFVEVSRVGESSIAEKYCVEAKQWQAALQEARKLRGDSGALSKFSIELLDRGYRAVDPALKLRYLINEAPADSPLTEEAPNGRSSGKLRVAEPASTNTSFATSAHPASLAPASPSLSPSAGIGGAPRPNSVSPPRPNSSAPRVSVGPSAAPRAQQLVVPHDPVPPAPLPPGSLLPGIPEPVRPEVPAFELVRQRAEEPRAESPITYRELAFAVQPGATRAQVEALLHDRYQATLATIEDRAPGKFVQLAVFDHVFKRRPERPPLATFAWKDWRGGPVVAFPGFGDAPMGPMSQVPPAPESIAPSAPPNGHVAPSTPPPSLSSLPLPPSLAHVSAVPVSAPVPSAPSLVPDSAPVKPMAPVVLESKPPPAAQTVAPVQAAPAPSLAAPAVSAPPVVEPPPVQVVALVAPPAPIIAEPFAPPAPIIAEPFAPPAPDVAVALAPAVADARPASAPGFELNFESTPFNSAPAERKSSPDRSSRPRLVALRRRSANEDLISELFEIMHDLHFMRDVAAGSEFVLSVLDEVLPCEGALVHVFDINTGHFVIVRAKGPNAAGVLLQRMPDKDPMVKSVMRAHRTTSVKDVSHTPRFLGPRWPALGVQPRVALCGPVQQGGRYLGLIELVNPLGDTPFHPNELNALDYICEQFAEFLSQKPIVLTADVVLAKS
ncbi:MAG: GAF domain-containing protein [Myxococcales bacterium]